MERFAWPPGCSWTKAWHTPALAFELLCLLLVVTAKYATIVQRQQAEIVKPVYRPLDHFKGRELTTIISPSRHHT